MRRRICISIAALSMAMSLSNVYAGEQQSQAETERKTLEYIPPETQGQEETQGEYSAESSTAASVSEEAVNTWQETQVPTNMYEETSQSVSDNYQEGTEDNYYEPSTEGFESEQYEESSEFESAEEESSESSTEAEAEDTTGWLVEADALADGQRTALYAEYGYYSDGAKWLGVHVMLPVKDDNGVSTTEMFISPAMIIKDNTCYADVLSLADTYSQISGDTIMSDIVRALTENKGWVSFYLPEDEEKSLVSNFKEAFSDWIPADKGASAEIKGEDVEECFKKDTLDDLVYAAADIAKLYGESGVYETIQSFAMISNDVRSRYILEADDAGELIRNAWDGVQNYDETLSALFGEEKELVSKLSILAYAYDWVDGGIVYERTDKSGSAEEEAQIEVSWSGEYANLTAGASPAVDAVSITDILEKLNELGLVVPEEEESTEEKTNAESESETYASRREWLEESTEKSSLAEGSSSAEERRQ